MPAFANRGATVNRLLIRSRMDPVTARLRASALLDESALQPPALPPAAILCIRRLTDPRPGAIALDFIHRVHSTGLPPRAWNDAVADRIAALARQAKRPGHGEATADAEAVVFADRAELLACLAADWCTGRLAAVWWWRALLQDVGDARVVLRAWLETPAYIAAAIDELASRGAATTFVERLCGADTNALLDAVVIQHGLTSLAPALELLERPDRSRSEAPRDSRVGDPVAIPDRPAPTLERSQPAPWTRWVPESQPQRLRAEQQCLLGIALMTRRAPTIVRTARFAAEVERWCIDTTRAAPATGLTSDAVSAAARGDDSVARDPIRHVQDEAPAPPLGAQARSRATGWSGGGTASDAEQPRQPRPDSESESPAPSIEQQVARGLGVSPDDRDASITRVGELSADHSVAGSTPTSSTAHARETLAVSGESAESNASEHVAHVYPASIETGVGGVFYLINVALCLGWYGDFTTPLQPGLDLSIWDFLTLMGRRLTPSRFRRDALWGLLAELTGVKDRNGGMDKKSAKDWMRRLLPPLRARFALALPGLDQKDVGALVCVHRARVVTSPTHVDVMFSLAELPIEVRLSGLDRDPGWVPAADRVIAFHYE